MRCADSAGEGPLGNRVARTQECGGSVSISPSPGGAPCPSTYLCALFTNSGPIYSVPQLQQEKEVLGLFTKEKVFV